MIRTVSSSLVLFILFFSQRALSSSVETTVASRFKAPNADTPEDIAEAWRQRDAELWSYVEKHVPAVLEHTGAAAFDEHLKGVQAVLRFWQAPSHLVSAGLFHSIYGTEGFQGFALPLTERAAIQNMIGLEAEKLCFVFCMLDRYSLDETVWKWQPGHRHDTYTLRARPELGRFPLTLTHEEWLDFIELTLADWLEQVEGAASKPSEVFKWKKGEAYAYRRTAYRRMSEILARERSPRLTEVAPAMLEAVMATEGPETRKLVQPRTPPPTKAGEAAWAALRAAGEDIPIDLSPQPMGEEEHSCDSASTG